MSRCQDVNDSMSMPCMYFELELTGCVNFAVSKAAILGTVLLSPGFVSTATDKLAILITISSLILTHWSLLFTSSAHTPTLLLQQHTSTTFPTSRSPHSTRLRRSVSKSDVDLSWLSTSCAKTGLCKNRWRSRQDFCRCWGVERRTRRTVR